MHSTSPRRAHPGHRAHDTKGGRDGDDKGKSELFGEGLPGTGGDYVDPNDVEGHVRLTEPEPRASRTRARPTVTPTARHRGPRQLTRSATESAGWGEGAPGRSGPGSPMTDDVEGHLYRGRPTTQGGEFAKRVPSDNPHGER